MGNSTSGDKGRYRHGYHVLMVKENTPAARAGLRPYFDYIMGINGIRLNKEDSVLRDQMESSEDRPVILDIYSTREQALRKVELTPVHKWDNGKDGYIGCSIRFCLFDTISDVVWHILDVAPGSPAMEAGLCAHADYVIGTPLGIMRGEQDLYDLVEDYIADELPLHVYNANTNEVREVIIIPREDWGGQGLLGCDVGFGYLHRLPKRDHISRQTNGSGDVKEKVHTAFVNTEKPVHKEAPIFQEKQQLETSSDEHMVTEKSTHHYQRVHDGNNNTDTQGAGNYETTVPTPQPARLETTLSTDERPVPEPAANYGDDGEEITTVTITELVSPEQAGTVTTATAEPAQSAEAVVTPITPTDNNETNTAATGATEEEEESRNNESLSTPVEKEVPPKSNVSETRISSEQPIGSEKTSDLASIDTTETPSSYQQQQQQQQQQHRPQAIAARMKPGIHGRGSFSAGIGGGRGRIGHDGFPRNGGISLQDVQAQAQQGSSEYREKEKLEKEERMSASNESLNVQVLDNDDDSNDDDGSYNEKKGRVKGERRRRRRTKEEMDADFHEIVVEGMIRNMSLGSSIFPL
ncbi:Golgi reassembly-stacking protein 2 [Linnemannia schmuckeri]|uniref:Golgi reassembly-stacking protein 2 n=1 Tax=Linnemannia schmuckeri TaxID=64567 RepID=A0A9P5V2F4_9FUNG|nr:Golgi reassembly-stacking protein 2 [Linnemannia schmuckeri]